MGEQYVGIDLHRRRSVIVRMTPQGEVLETIRIDNDPVALSLELAKAGPDPEVVLEATYGWYWAADLLQACGARVHLAHPLGVKMFGYQRVKTDARDSTNLAELLRMHRLPEAWLAPPLVRELRELRRLPRQAGGAAQRPQGPSPRRARQGRRAGADERPVRGRGHPAAGPIAAGARLRLADRLAAQPHHRLRPGDRDAGAGDLHGPGRRRRLPGHPDHPRGGPGAGRRLRGRDRRRGPLRRRATVVLLGRTDAPPPRVRHHRAPWPHHQAGPPAGPLGRGRGGAAAARRKQAGRRPATASPTGAASVSAASPPPASC